MSVASAGEAPLRHGRTEGRVGRLSFDVGLVGTAPAAAPTSVAGRVAAMASRRLSAVTARPAAGTRVGGGVLHGGGRGR